MLSFISFAVMEQNYFVAITSVMISGLVLRVLVMKGVLWLHDYSV